MHAAQRRAAAGGAPPASQRHPAAGRGRRWPRRLRAADRAGRRADRAQRRRPAGQPRRAGRPDRRAQAGGQLASRAGSGRCSGRPTDLQSTSSRRPGPAGRGHRSPLRALQISTGFVPVHGPGLRITVADNPDGSADGRVRATRPAAAGQRAVAARAPRRSRSTASRLSTISAILNSNIAVQVNRSPLTPPYVVSAIGDRSPGRPAARPRDRRWQFQALADAVRLRRSTGRMRASSPCPRRPTRSCGCATPGRGAGPPDNQEDAP